MKYIHKDHLAGLLLIVLGGGAIFYARALAYGTLQRMGPGYFPTAVGIILILLGVAIAVTAGKADKPNEIVAPTAEGEPEAADILSQAHAAAHGGSHKPEWRAWFLIILSFVAFIELFDHAGVIPATVAICVISTFAERQNSWKSAVGVAITMCVVLYVVFYYALKMPLHLFWWD